MKTLIIATILVFAVNIIFYLPLYIRKVKARRSRRLQEAKTEIVTCATELQKYLLDADTVYGQYVHDVLYEAINSAQFFDRYVMLRFVFGKQKHEVDKVNDIIEHEMKNLSPKIKDITERFFKAFVKAAYYRHPIKFKVIVLILLTRYFLLKPSIFSVFTNVFFNRLATAACIVAIGLIAFGNMQDINHDAQVAARVASERG